MALLTESEVRSRATSLEKMRKSTASAILKEAADADETFDVFLSHSSNEPEEILAGIVGFLEDENLSVYVDKYTDPQLSPDNVTKGTATTLRRRLSASRSLLYVYSRFSTKSRWMPWELGFMDGKDKPIGIVPVADRSLSSFAGEEFLSLYPYLDRAQIQGSSRSSLWINSSSTEYANFERWIRGQDKIQKRI